MSKLIRISSIISLFFLFTSCKHLKVEGNLIQSESPTYTVPFFNNENVEYLYSSRINAYGNAISGLLVIKKIGEGHKRLALLTDFGNTLLDFEFIGEEIKVNYVVENLNKKLIVNQLKNNFQLLLQSDYQLKEVYEVENGKVLTTKFQKKHVFLYLDTEGNLTRLIQANSIKNKIEIKYFGEDKSADSIVFSSFQLPLQVILNKRN